MTRCAIQHNITRQTGIWCTCSYCQYLDWSLALGPGIPHQAAGASTREGVLHPKLSLAQVLAVEVATAGILVATVRVRIHLGRATWIPRWPWERVTEKHRRKKCRGGGQRRVRGTADRHHKRFHNRHDLYLDGLTNDKWHSRGMTILSPYVSKYHGTSSRLSEPVMRAQLLSGTLKGSSIKDQDKARLSWFV